MSEAPPLQIAFSLSREDVEAHVRLHEARARSTGYRSSLSYLYAPVALSLAIMLLAGVAGFTTAQFGAALAIALASYLAGVLCYSHEVDANYRQLLERRVSDPLMLGARTLALHADRVTYTSDVATASLAYTLLDEPEIVTDWLCIWSDTTGALVVPLRAFASRGEAEAYCEELRRRVVAARSAPRQS
ncbi:MAG: hypothetical protein NW223_00070 [Hyphomicrobiaceae bacterium]|nr:hypothetical protein [Hyphomicrobiaceae bacterium]